MSNRAAPIFAMSFLPDAVLLERRQGHDWQFLGQAKFAGGNIRSRLNALRGDHDLGSSELDTVLVIPDDQILYTRVTVTPGSDVADAVAHTLEGMTPFTADQLAFDWCPDRGGKTDSLRVAAVSRQTLKEAEEFARNQGFSPIGFEGRPGDDRFTGQPDFGPSRQAKERRTVAPFSKPNLRMAGINSAQIEIEDFEPALKEVVPQNYTRIPPHYSADAPATSPELPVPDRLETDLPTRVESAAATEIKHLRPDIEQPIGELSARARAIHLRAAEIWRQREEMAKNKAPQQPRRRKKLIDFSRLGDLFPGTLSVLVMLLSAMVMTGLWFLGAPSGRLEIVTPPGTVTGAPDNPTPSAAEVNAAIVDEMEAARQDPVIDATLTHTPALVPPAADALPEPIRHDTEDTFGQQDAVANTLKQAMAADNPSSAAAVFPGEPQSSVATGLRPVPRPETTPDESGPARQPARPFQEAAQTDLESSYRPASRPGDLAFPDEGSASDDRVLPLSIAERDFLEQMLRDLRTAQVGPQGLSKQERGAVIRLAQARPAHKPVEVSQSSEAAVRDALSQALKSSSRPPQRRNTPAKKESTSANEPAPAKDSAAASLSRSGRPAPRPAGATRGSAGPSLAKDAIESAVAAAVGSSAARQGAVPLTALTSSKAPPPRRENRQVTATATANNQAAATRAQEEAELAAQRRIDDELQAQAEARMRARAAADARAEANARAQAEARARAQAEAEARAAALRKQRYAPPEAENEPEFSGAVSGGKTPRSVAAAATVKDGIQLSRTQIIGTIGAGKASRALVRLSNGRVLTLRVGDKINGGRITEIGNSRIIYVEGGRSKQLSVLNGQ